MKKLSTNIVSLLFVLILTSCSFISEKKEGCISFSAEQVRTLINNARNQINQISEEDGFYILELEGDYSIYRRLNLSTLEEDDIETINAFLTITNIPVGSRITVKLSLFTEDNMLIFTAKSKEVIIQEGNNVVEITIKFSEFKYIAPVNDYYFENEGENSILLHIGPTVTDFTQLQTILENQEIIQTLEEYEEITLNMAATNIKEINAARDNNNRAYSIFKPFTKVYLPVELDRICESSFYECNRLKSITIFQSVMYIGNYAFFGCNSLEEAIFVNPFFIWEINSETIESFIPDYSDYTKNADALKGKNFEWIRTAQSSLFMDNLSSKLENLSERTLQIGDIVLKDNRVLPYDLSYSQNDWENFAEKENIVAIIFRVAENGSNALGVGVMENGAQLKWCVDSANGMNTISTITCVVLENGTEKSNCYWKDNCSFQQGSAINGSNNILEVEKLYDFSTNTSNYPAFVYAKNYGTTEYVGTEYSSGWFIPSLSELVDIWKNINILNDVLLNLGDSVQLIETAEEDEGGAYYFSSNQLSDYSKSENVYVLDMYDGYVFGYKKSSTAFVRVIHEF